MPNDDRIINPTEYPDGPQPGDLEPNQTQQGQDGQPQPVDEPEVERNEGQDVTEDGKPVKKGRGKRS
jgi:hypothetical protein